MRKWLYDRPWIWIVVLLTFLVIGGFTTLVIAELNKPEIVKEKRTSMVTSASSVLTPANLGPHTQA